MKHLLIVLVVERFGGKKRNTTIEMKEETNGSTSLDQASDNNVAEIMDAEDPLLFFTRLDLLVNQKNGAYHSWIHGVYLYTFKNVFNYKITIFLVYC
jgi:acetyl-CoA synthetase